MLAQHGQRSPPSRAPGPAGRASPAPVRATPANSAHGSNRLACRRRPARLSFWIFLRSWPAVSWNDHDQVTGLWGLAPAGMPPHRVERAGVKLSAWCALDPLYLARVIG